MDNSLDLDPMDYCPYSTRPVLQRPSLSTSRFVKSLINKNKVVIFSKSSCPHCDDSKSLLNDMGVEYTTVELDQMNDGSSVQNTLGQMTNAKTVPRIFIKGQCVGGNSDLHTMSSTGELRDMLVEARQSRRATRNHSHSPIRGKTPRLPRSSSGKSKKSPLLDHRNKHS